MCYVAPLCGLGGAAVQRVLCFIDEGKRRVSVPIPRLQGLVLMIEKKPDFLCVGLPKAGTSTIHHVLDCHPDIAMPPVKEVKFLIADKIGYARPRVFALFGRDWPAQQDRAFLYRFVKKALRLQISHYQWRSVFRYYFGISVGTVWYQGLFHRDLISGDVTVNYFWLTEQDVTQLARDFPWLKIILMLRSPVELNWSYFRMISLRKNERDVLELKRFQKEIEDKKRNIGRYIDLIDRWKNVFGNNLFVGYFDDLKDEPERFFDEVCGFLGVAQASNWTEGMKGAMGTVVNNSPPLSIPPELAGPLLDLSEYNLDGFEAVSAQYKDLWMAQVEDLKRQIGISTEVQKAAS